VERFESEKSIQNAELKEHLSKGLWKKEKEAKKKGEEEKKD